jgi:hypothetical protein
MADEQGETEMSVSIAKKLSDILESDQSNRSLDSCEQKLFFSSSIVCETDESS